MQKNKEDESIQESSNSTLAAFSCHPVEQWIVPNAKIFRIDDEHEARVMVAESVAACMGLNNIGRKSYNKFNPEVEKLMQQPDTDSQANDDEKADGTIPALEVAARYQQLMNKSLPSKRTRPSNTTQSKPKRFQKP